MLPHNIVTPCCVLDLLALHGVLDVVALVNYYILCNAGETSQKKDFNKIASYPVFMVDEVITLDIFSRF